MNWYKKNLKFLLLKNILTLHNHYLRSSRCQMLCVFVFIYFQQFAKTILHHKNLTIAPNKKPASRELLSECLSFESSIYKGNMEHTQTESVKNAINKFKK